MTYPVTVAERPSWAASAWATVRAVAAEAEVTTTGTATATVSATAVINRPVRERAMLLIFMLSDAIGIDVNSGRSTGQHSMPDLRDIDRATTVATPVGHPS
ncbi:hypothetical protein Misp04_15300 [Micromonospora sp. NBRC 101691]|nr:hypothetical protein Misp04_15300 [Micromonospora sp. NBRC 101691]